MSKIWRVYIEIIVGYEWPANFAFNPIHNNDWTSYLRRLKKMIDIFRAVFLIQKFNSLLLKSGNIVKELTFNWNGHNCWNRCYSQSSRIELAPESSRFDSSWKQSKLQ